MKASPLSVAVLISGTGSNLKTLIDAKAEGRLVLDVCHVISNREQAGGLEHARRAGISFSVINAQDRKSQDGAVAECLRQFNPELIILAGYMRILGADLVAEFNGRMINLHPSLLPKYRGLNTYRRVLEAGDVRHGASIHFVTAALDDGPVIGQVRIPVLPGDTQTSLAARLGPMEHRLLIAVLELFTARRVQMRHGKAVLDGNVLFQPLVLGEDPGFD